MPKCGIMKKILWGFICLMCSSCIVTTTFIGDVTAYTQNGEVLQKWEQVFLQKQVPSSGYTEIKDNAFKTFGINFYDHKSGKFIVVGNAVPCIIEYTTTTSSDSFAGQQTYIGPSKEELISQWEKLSKQEKELNASLKSTNKGSAEYKNIKAILNGIATQMWTISDKLWRYFNYDITAK